MARSLRHAFFRTTGDRVTAMASNREGERCDWSDAPEVPVAASGSWGMLTLGLAYFTYRSLRPLALAHALRIKVT